MHFHLVSPLMACLWGAELPPAPAFTDLQKEGLPGKEVRKERRGPFGFNPQGQVLGLLGVPDQIVKEVN